MIVVAIGKGGFGTVYRAFNVDTGQTVAIKQISLDSIPKDQLAGIRMEIDLLKKLRHDHIVTYLGSFNTKNHLNIVLEYMESGSLQAIVKKFGTFPEQLVVLYLKQVLDGLAYLHEQGVIHRDIKGANILTTKDGHVKLADFGVATKLTDLEGTSASVVGTPYWMAPEIIELAGPSTASDIWSVGCTIVELIAGSPPYYELAPMPALFRIVQDDHPPLPDSLSSACKDFLMQCFQKDPNLRVSAKQLLKHRWIRQFTKSNPVASMPPDAAAEAIKKQQAASSPPPVSGVDDDQDASLILGGASSYGKLLRAPAPAPPVAPSGSGKSGGAKKRGSGRKSGSKHKTPASPPPPVPSAPGGLGSPRSKALSQYAEEEDDDDWDDFGDAFKGAARPRLIRPDQLAVLDVNNQAADLFGGSGGGAASKLAQFAEDEFDDGDFDDDFDLGGASTSGGSSSNKSLSKSMNSLTLTASGGGGLAAQLKARMNAAAQSAPLDLGEVDDDDDDPFADVFDDEDLSERDDTVDAANRDKFARQSAEILRLIGTLQPGEKESVILSSCEKLGELIRNYPEARAHLITHHGVIPIMEMLEVDNTKVLHSVLRVVNQILDGSPEIQENLCLVGGIPAIMRFAGGGNPDNLRAEAASFVSKMCHTSAITLQMFVASRGLPVLVQMLDPDYKHKRELVWSAVDNILRIFEMQSSTPKNDFCRLFAKSNLLPRLAFAYSNMLDDKHPQAEEYRLKVANLFLIFSHADTVVKGHMAQQEVLKRLLDRRNGSPEVIVRILKALKFLSMDPNTLEPLQKAKAIEKLMPVFAFRLGGMPLVTDMHNQVLSMMFNLVRINRVRQQQAAVAGIIPHLMYFINSNSPLKQFALPIFCDLAHASKRSREELWKNNGLQQYLELLAMNYWQVNALDSIAVWLADETKKVESVLHKPENVARLIALFSTAQSVSFVNILEPMLKILYISVVVNRDLGAGGLVPVLLERLSHPNALVRVNLLKILKVIYEYHKKPKSMITEYKLYPIVRKLQKNDNAVLVQEMASQLLTGFSANSVL